MTEQELALLTDVADRRRLIIRDISGQQTALQLSLRGFLCDTGTGLTNFDSGDRTKTMNPFEMVFCYNSDADERHVTRMRRWQLWWCRWFGNDYARCWREQRPR